MQAFSYVLTFVFHIGQLARRQKQVTLLLHSESVVLEHVAREHDMLCQKTNSG